MIVAHSMTREELGARAAVIACVRAMRSPQSARDIAKYTRKPLSFVERALQRLFATRHVLRAVNEDNKEIVWTLRLRRLKVYEQRLERQSKAAASYFNTVWVPGSLISRMNLGISIRALGWPCGAASMTSEISPSTSSESSSTKPPLGTTAEQDSGAAL